MAQSEGDRGRGLDRRHALSRTLDWPPQRGRPKGWDNALAFGWIKLDLRGKPVWQPLLLALVYPLAFFTLQTFGLEQASSTLSSPKGAASA